MAPFQLAEEPNMSNAADLTNETRRFSINYFYEQYKEGWLIIIGECQAYLSEWRARRREVEAPLDIDHVASVSNVEKVNKASWDREHQQQQQQRNNLDDGQSCGTLIYGLGCLSKIFHVMLHVGPGFVFDMRPGLLPSKGFMLVHNAVLIIIIVAGFFVAKLILEPTLIDVLPGLDKNIIQLLALCATTCQVLITTYGLGSLLVVVYNCPFVRDFTLFRCNIISLPKSFQRRKAVELFFCHYVLAVLSKPVPLSLRLIYDPQHPNQLVHWSSGAFALARAASIAITGAGSMLICTAGMVVPYISSFLIVCSAKHLNDLLSRQLVRLNGTTSELREPKRANCTGKAQLLDEQTRQIIADYSCDTLTEDWPQLIIGHADDADDDDDDEEEGEEEEEDSSGCEHGSEPQQSKVLPGSRQQRESRIIDTEAPEVGSQVMGRLACCFAGFAGSPDSRVQRKLPPVQMAHEELRSCRPRREGADSLEMDRLGAEAGLYNSAANSLLFLYKNLIKSMSELKGMIAIYERKFGTLHLIQICVDSLIVAQWINTSLTESRLRQESRLAPNHSGRANHTSEPPDESLVTPLLFETTFGVLSFVITNTYIFMTCDCLPDSMVKMRSKLFKMNVDLAQSALRARARHLNRVRSTQPGSIMPRKSPLAAPVGSDSSCQQLCGPKPMQRIPLELITADECAELDQVWSLYDQVDRLSELANFRLTAGTYYSKRCLLWIFGRTVSLTLLCIQIVDIYSYT